MKRKILFLPILLMSLTSCGKQVDENNQQEHNNKPETVEHVHNFDKQVTKDEYLASPSTCDKSTMYYYSCECGEKGTEMFSYGNPKGHVFDRKIATERYLNKKATCTEAATYFYSCECGEKGSEIFSSGEALGHSFSNYVYNGDADCTRNGTETAICDRCSKTDTREALHTKLEHVFNQQVKSREYAKTMPTCTEDGVYYYSCVCGEKGTETFSGDDKLGHSFIHYSSYSEADHSHNATEISICERCGEEDIRECPNTKVPHNFNVKSTNEKFLKSSATCEHPAIYYYSCECGEIGSQTFEYGKKLAHNFANYVKNNDASCGSNETETGYCTVCNAPDTREIPNTATGIHNFVGKVEDEKYLKSAATCCQPATYYYSCTECGRRANYTFEVGSDLGGHHYENGKCKDCGITDLSFDDDDIHELLHHTLLNEKFVFKSNNRAFNNLYVNKGCVYANNNSMKYMKKNGLLMNAYISTTKVGTTLYIDSATIGNDEMIMQYVRPFDNKFIIDGGVYDIFSYLFSKSYSRNDEGVYSHNVSNEKCSFTIKNGKINEIFLVGSTYGTFDYETPVPFSNVSDSASDFEVTESTITSSFNRKYEFDITSEDLKFTYNDGNRKYDYLFDSDGNLVNYVAYDGNGKVTLNEKYVWTHTLHKKIYRLNDSDEYELYRAFEVQLGSYSYLESYEKDNRYLEERTFILPGNIKEYKYSYYDLYLERYILSRYDGFYFNRTGSGIFAYLTDEVATCLYNDEEQGIYLNKLNVIERYDNFMKKSDTTYYYPDCVYSKDVCENYVGSLKFPEFEDANRLMIESYFYDSNFELTKTYYFYVEENIGYSTEYLINNERLSTTYMICEYTNTIEPTVATHYASNDTNDYYIEWNYYQSTGFDGTKTYRTAWKFYVDGGNEIISSEIFNPDTRQWEADE